jgi:hypothetical protein
MSKGMDYLRQQKLTQKQDHDEIGETAMERR